MVRTSHFDVLLGLAFEEDLSDRGDVTTRAFVEQGTQAHASIVARQDGILSGAPVLDEIISRHAEGLDATWSCHDGSRIAAGDEVCTITGSLSLLLPVERVMLNMLGRMSGIATMTAGYVEASAGTDVRICDTRKTTPALRSLEKYAVRCGGGHLHRMGLHDAVLVKDNHVGGLAPTELAEHVCRAVDFARAEGPLRFVEVEVDDLDQLAALLELAPGTIDIILLDNMTPDVLREAVGMRDEHAPDVLLEASGGITIESIPEIAATGIDRISIGALTHSAVQLDFGLDLK